MLHPPIQSEWQGDPKWPIGLVTLDLRPVFLLHVVCQEWPRIFVPQLPPARNDGRLELTRNAFQVKRRSTLSFTWKASNLVLRETYESSTLLQSLHGCWRRMAMADWSWPEMCSKWKRRSTFSFTWKASSLVLRETYASSTLFGCWRRMAMAARRQVAKNPNPQRLDKLPAAFRNPKAAGCLSSHLCGCFFANWQAPTRPLQGAAEALVLAIVR